MKLRRAVSEDIKDIAVIQRQSLRTALPDLPDIHTPEEDIAYFRDKVFVESEIWVAELDRIIGFIAFRDGWVDQLYILPGHQGQGAGKKLLARAREKNEQLNLWTFQKNAAARGFYEAQGFAPVRLTDGRGNDEKEPDVLYQWTGLSYDKASL